MLTESIENLCLLVARYSDHLAFKKIFHLYYPRLVIFTKNYTKSRESAEEIVQDVFLKIWENRETLQAIQNLNYYLFVAAKHAALNYMAKHKRNIHVSLEDTDTVFNEISQNPESALISAQALKLIQSMINTLPAKCKMVFQMVKEDGLKYSEVAHLLNLSVKTVEAHMTLALKKISGQLNESYLAESKKSM